MSVNEITNHVDAAKNRLVQQYKDKPRIAAILLAFIEQIQEMETVGKELNDERSVSGSVGEQLNKIGEIVGITRLGGESDVLYRARINARISLNVSEGEPERLISTFILLIGADSVLLQELPPADVAISSSSTFADQDEVDAALAILENVAPAGVRVNYIGVYDSAEPFSMGGSLSGLGFSSTGNPTAGGKFSKIERRNSFFSMEGEADLKNEGFGTIKDVHVGGLMDKL